MSISLDAMVAKVVRFRVNNIVLGTDDCSLEHEFVLGDVVRSVFAALLVPYSRKLGRIWS